MSKYANLIERLEAATGQDVDLDADICFAVQYGGRNSEGATNVRVEDGGDTNDLIFEIGEYQCCNWTPKLTSRMDAVIGMIESKLLGWAWKVGTCSVSDDAWLVPDFNCPVHGERLRQQFGYESIVVDSIWDTGIDVDLRPPGRPAIAMCIAFLKALEAIEAHEGGNG